jgi:arylsulfatase A-like enzyme
MHTPLWSNRRLGQIPLRTIDLFPTMLDWLGETIPPSIDGELVWKVRG